MKRIFWLLVVIFAPLSNIALTSPLPVDAFANLPDVRFVTLSPDGTKIASLIRVNNNTLDGQMLSIRDINTNKDIFPVQTDNQRFVILSLTWASNDIILITAKYPATRRQGLIILDRFSYILFKNKEIKNSLIDLASVIK